MVEMQPTMEILAKISKNSQSNKNEVFTKLFRYLLRPDIYFEYMATMELLQKE